MNIQPYQAIPLGKYISGGNKLQWAWSHEYHARLAIFGDDHQTKKLLLSHIASFIQEQDDNVVYWITSNDRTEKGETVTPQNILDFESLESYSDNNISEQKEFIEHRRHLASMYFDLLAIKKGIDRKALLSESTYREHIEGPLMGYLRAIQETKDKDLKQWLEQQTLPLGKVKFKKTEKGRIYSIDTALEPIDQIIKFYRACWSLWAFLSTRIEQQQYLFMIEFPEVLFSSSMNQQVQQIIHTLLQYLNTATMVTTTSLVTTSTHIGTLYTQNYRHKLFMEGTKDLSLEDENNINFFTKEVIQSWKQKKKNVFLWLDEADKKRYILQSLKN
jgi:hypothetical protein